jgi:replicative DNA helicase
MGELALVAARPAIGTGSFLARVVAAAPPDRSVLVFALRARPDTLVARLLRHERAATLGTRKIAFDWGPAASVSRLRASIVDTGAELVVIDALDDFSEEAAGESSVPRRAATGDTAWRLRALAHELDVAVVAALAVPEESDEDVGDAPRLPEFPVGVVAQTDTILVTHLPSYYMTLEEATMEPFPGHLQVTVVRDGRALETVMIEPPARP